MSLTIGDTAPDFTLVTMGEKGPELLTLSEELQKSKVVLLFVPMAFTGGCTKEFCTISAGMAEYESLGAKVIGVSGDNPFAQAAWAEKEGFKITQVSDYEHLITKAYGVAYEHFLPAKNLIMGGVPKRSAFVIGQDGKILYAEVLENPGEMPDFTKVKAALRE